VRSSPLTAVLLALPPLLAAGPSSPLGAQSSALHGAHATAAAPSTAASSLAPEEAAFLDAARAATERYRELPTAIADGYRRVGGELPSMGEHWLHNGRALADTLDPAAPPILIYYRVAGRPQLAGAAYTHFLAPDAPYPSFPSGDAHAWHDHNGSVAEEVLPLGHVAAGARPTRAGSRIGVMHAWLWLANPAGPFAPNNWALPYARLGLAPPAGDSGAAAAAAARALSLANGGDAYYVHAIVAAAAPNDSETARVGAILAGYGGFATELAARLAARPPRESRAPEVAALAALWEPLWSQIAAVLRPETSARLDPLRAALVPGAAPAR